MDRDDGAGAPSALCEEVISWRHSGRYLLQSMKGPMMFRFWIWCAFVLLLTEGCLKKCRSLTLTHQDERPTNISKIINNDPGVVGKYATYDETMAWYNQLAKANKGLVKLYNIGKSYEGRAQVVIRISPFPVDTRPAIFIEGGMHAREWLSPSTANYLIAEMIGGYNRGDAWYRRALSQYVFYFMSISNPDGYVFTFDRSNPENRFWRKNRRRNKNGCVGVDLNRNFDIDFGGRGASLNPCSGIYHGTGAFSEPETMNIKRFTEQTLRKRSLQLYISLHTYSQLWIVPFSYRVQRPEPALDKELHRAANVAAQATLRATGKTYQVLNGAQAFGVTAAGSDDWMLAKMKARYSYTLELRPSAKSVSYWKDGFNQPASEILPTGRDALAALKALVNTMRTVRTPGV